MDEHTKRNNGIVGGDRRVVEDAHNAAAPRGDAPARREPRSALGSDGSQPRLGFAGGLQVAANLAVAASVIVATCQLQLTSEATRQASEATRQASEATHRASRLQSWGDLFATFDEMNDYVASHAVAGPLYPEFRSNPATTTLVFHHVNLAFRAWQYREIGTLNADEFAGFENWLDKVVFAWLVNQPCVAADFDAILNTGDLHPKPFRNWLLNHPGYGRAKRVIAQCATPPIAAAPPIDAKTPSG